MDLKDQWTTETAMKILQHKTVDSQLWAEAVEWLMLYGPPEIREILIQASGSATHSCFPDLKADGYAADGQACYKVEDLANSLKMSAEEAKEILKKKQDEQGVAHFIDEDETHKVH